MTRPNVSVIIPTYNRAELICQTIENVFQQTYQDFEIIIVDDGSTDDTLQKLAKFGEKIRVVTQANAGAAAARNRGAKVASGEMIAFQDSDDVWMPTKLEKQLKVLQDARADVSCCLCNAEMHFADKSTTSFELAWLQPAIESGLWTNVAEVLSTTSVLFNQCSLIRSETFKKIGGFDEQYRYMEDYDLPMRLSLEGRTWAFVREPLVIWRQGSPQSLYLQAMGNEIRLKECELQIREAAAERVKGIPEFEELEKILRRERKRNERELAIAKISRAKIPGTQNLVWLLRKIERYRNGIRRRRTYFPRMKVQTLKAEAATMLPELTSK
jgi:glycosyltransferase involved in cell wall biosynthesis